MSAQNRYATLESELMGKGAEAPPAPPSRRRTADRITGRVTTLSAAPQAPAPAAAEPAATRAMAPAPAVEPSPGDAFYDKGAATADNFRPAYWTYDRATPGAAAQGPDPAAAPVETKRVIEPAPAEPAPIEAPAAAIKEQRREPPAVAGVPDTATVADELAATIEHVLGSRYAGTRTAPEAEPKPRLVASAVTSDSLMAELKQARQSRAPEDKPAASSRSAHRPKKAPSFLDRAFLFGGCALVLFVLLVLSPWRDTFLSPSIAHFFG